MPSIIVVVVVCLYNLRSSREVAINDTKTPPLVKSSAKLYDPISSIQVKCSNGTGVLMGTSICHQKASYR
jgi:hypothetical protein